MAVNGVIMSWTFVANRGTVTVKTPAGTTLSINPSANLAVNAIIIVAAGWIDPASSDETNLLSIADDQGNSWTKLREHSNTGRGTIALFACKVTTQISTTDQITVTGFDTGARIITVQEFSVAGGFTFSLAGANGATFASGGPTVTLSGLTNAEYLWVGASAREAPGTYTEDADYSNAIAANTTGGSGASNLAANSASRTLTATTDTYNPTGSGHSGGAIILVALSESAAAAGAGWNLTGVERKLPRGITRGIGRGIAMVPRINKFIKAAA